MKKSLVPIVLLAALVCIGSVVALLAIEDVGDAPTSDGESAAAAVDDAEDGNAAEAARTVVARKTPRDRPSEDVPEAAEAELLDITGVVTDEADAPLAGARIEAFLIAEGEETALESLLREVTDIAGDFTDDVDVDVDVDGSEEEGTEDEAGEGEAVDGEADETTTVVRTTGRPRVGSRNVRRMLRGGGLRRLARLGNLAPGMMGDDDNREPDATALTDSDGAFVVKDVAPGTYRLRVHARGHVTGTRDRVEAGGEPVSLRLESALVVRGIVRSTDGAAVAGARVSAHGRTVETSGSGAFEHDGVEPGSTRFVVRADGHVSAARMIEREIDSPDELIEITLAAAGVIEGVVTAANGVAIAGAEVTPDSDILGSAMRSGGNTVSFLEDTSSAATAPSAETGDDGRYVLSGMPAGTATLVVSAAGYLDGKIEDVEVRAGQTTPGVDVALTAEAALIGVIRDEGGEPVKDATVAVALPEQEGGMGAMFATMFGGDDTSGESDPDGAYRVAQIPAGEHEVTISAEGYLSQKSTATFAAGRTETLDVSLVAGFTVAGVVLDPDGQPLADADVNVQWPSKDDSDNPMAGMMSSMFGGEGADVTTDAEGRFTATGLQAGPYVVKAEHDEHLEASVRDVAPGTTDVEVTLGLAGVVMGRVTSIADGQPVADAQVQKKGGANKGGIFAMVMQGLDREVTLSDGTFRLGGLSAGKYQFWATKDGHAASEKVAVQVVPGETIENVELVLREPVTLRGRVVDAAGGGAVVGARLSVADQDSPFGGMGIRMQINISDDGEGVAVTDASGRFELGGLTPGRITVQIDSDTHAGKSVRGVEVPGKDLTIELSSGGTVSGVVRGPDGSPEVGASVALQSMMAGNLTAETDASGRYLFEHVTPGTYRAMLIKEDVNPFANMRMKSVTVRDGETTELDFVETPAKGVTVEGTVFESGKPLKGATIVLNRGGAGMRMENTDASGKFSFSGVEPGTYQVLAQRGLMGGGSVSAEVVVGEQGVESGAIRLELSSLAVKGTVVDAETGEPVAMALLRVIEGQAGAASVEEAMRAQRGQGFSGPDGSFEIKGVPSGSFRLYVTASGYASKYVDAVQAGAKALTVKLSSGTEIEVTVVGPSGQSVQGATVHADDPQGQERAGLDLNLQGLSDADGIARLRLEPGEYRLRVAAPGFAPATASVHTRTGSVKVTLTSGGALSLEVVDGAGTPVSGATVVLLDAAGEAITDRISLRNSMAGLSAATGADGRWVREGLPAGNLTVVVRNSAGGEARRAVAIAPGETASVRLELP